MQTILDLLLLKDLHGHGSPHLVHALKTRLSKISAGGCDLDIAVPT